MTDHISKEYPVAKEYKNKEDHRTENRRRKGLGLLAFYLAGGPEQRYRSDRRTIKNKPPVSLNYTQEKRAREERRKVIHTKYLNCGKCIDTRKKARRSAEKIDMAAVEREGYKRLGPGWL